MANIPVALQLYSLRDAAKADFLKTIRDVATLGYEGVEFAGFFDQPAAAVKKAVADAGLRIAGAHIGSAALRPDTFNATVDYHLELGNTHLTVPAIPEDMWKTADARKQTVAFFNEINEKLAARGLRTGYHSHAFDVQPLPEGGTLYDEIIAGTPKSFNMQIDVGNTVSGGVCPVSYLERYAGRAEQVHLKEGRVGKSNIPFGGGDVPWREVFQRCQAIGGTQWYIVEVESYWDEPLECARQDRVLLRRLMGQL